MLISVTHSAVFGKLPMNGNPAPIVFDADGLSSGQMHAVAAHFGQETVFVLKPLSPTADVQFKFFLPTGEMDMCVHASVGAITAMLLRSPDLKSPVRVETSLGIVAVPWRKITDDQILVMVEQFPPQWSSHIPDRDRVAAALRIAPAQITDSAWPIQSVSTSRSKLIVPVGDWRVLDELQPDFDLLWDLCDTFQLTGFYPFTVQTLDQSLPIEARQFPRRAGFNEDPATGVAASALSAYLAKHHVLGQLSDGWQAFEIGQGRAMGQPCIIHAEVLLQAGEVASTRVGGTAQIVSHETLEIPESANG